MLQTAAARRLLHVKLPPTACRAYLKPVRDGKCSHNLRIIEGAYASRVLFNDAGNTATGIAFIMAVNGTESVAPLVDSPDSEVFVTSGPYGSPKLLQLSGAALKLHGVAHCLICPVKICYFKLLKLLTRSHERRSVQ